MGDTVVLAGRLDPQIAAAGEDRALVVRGMVEWLYDYRSQPSVGAVLPVMQRLARQPTPDPASLVLVTGPIVRTAWSSRSSRGFGRAIPRWR